MTMEKNIIPKIIHYCWFGGKEKPELVKKCIESWKKQLQDYNIIEWNESNFDVNMLEYTKQAYMKKKYAFVADFARLWVLQKYGGIYLDTDVEVLKSLNCFLTDEMFCGFESPNGVNPGLVLGAKKEHPLFEELMFFYKNNNFINENKVINTYTTVQNMTDVLRRHGLILNCNMTQRIDGIAIYPQITFCPDKNTRDSKRYSKETYTAHHYMASWMSPKRKERLKSPFWRLVYSILGKSGKLARVILGEKRWVKIRNQYLSKLYDVSRGIK